MMVAVSCKRCGAKVEAKFPVPVDVRCTDCSAAPVELHPEDYDPCRESDAARWMRVHATARTHKA